MLWWQQGDLSSLVRTPYDGATITLSVLALNPVTVAVLFAAVRLAKADPVRIFGPGLAARARRNDQVSSALSA